MGITEAIVNFIVNLIGSLGYASIVILMTLESMVAPVPSEAVMPFAGFLIAEGKFTFPAVIFFSTLGSLIGSLISYYLGDLGGRPVVERWGKYLLLDTHHLTLAEDYFKKRGDITILVCRFIPVIRHLISIPAGMGKMNLFKFCLYTVVGAGLWNTILTYAGFVLRSNWAEIMKYSHIIDYIVIAAIIAAIGYYIYSYRKNRKS
jgi:membrane protein DedA with SNARE-associated domain